MRPKCATISYMHWDNRVNNTNIRDTTALRLCFLALTQPLWSVSVLVYVCVHAGSPVFLFVLVHARSNVMFSCVKAHILASPAPFGIPGEKTPDGGCYSLMGDRTITALLVDFCTAAAIKLKLKTFQLQFCMHGNKHRQIHPFKTKEMGSATNKTSDFHS